MRTGLFFDNYTKFLASFSLLAACLEKNRECIRRLAEELFSDVKIFFTGTGRSGQVALRAMKNFEEGLGREAYYSGYGYGKAEEGDMLIAVSGSGRTKTTLEHVMIAKNNKMKVATVTYSPEADIAQKSDIVITLPGRVAGEKEIRDFYERQIRGEYLPLQVLGSIFEISSLAFVDAFSYAFSRYRRKDRFPWGKLRNKIYGTFSYLGEAGYMLEKQREKIRNLIKKLEDVEGEICLTGFRYTTEIAEMGAIRLNHAIYKPGKRARVLDSRTFPVKIKEGLLIAISGSGESWFTKRVAKEFKGKGIDVIALTYGKNSSLYRMVGEENSIIFPRGRRYLLKNGYVLRDFEIGAAIFLDCLAISLGRSEEEMRKVHSIFG